ncbi:Cof-type HAD-IIB family hydrolase [Corynebacterium diphtheriae]|nr:Cof-type HAD-IIB family hydrolase [Corynebacterium diphtheriae]
MSALIVSDIDGTLIDSRERIPSAVKESLAAAQRAGVSFVVATGRPARWIHPIIDQLYIPPTLCVCANGAVIYDPARDRITYRRELASDTMRTVVRVAREALSDLGGCGVGVERAGMSAHDMPSELFMVTPDFVHSWESIEHSTVELDRVLARPAVKLLLRNDALTSEQMHRLVAP